MKFTKATKEQSKLRCTVFGPSGSGKTFTALCLGTGILQEQGRGKIALIDTERGRAKKHSSKFDFDVLELNDHRVESYMSAIRCAAQAGYDVLIIDSLTHAWQAILEEVDKLAKTKFKNNSFQAWSEGTPLQKKLINELLCFNGHLICTMRSKTDWVVEKNENGKSQPRRVGTTPEQGKGIEYEFDFIFEMDAEHNANIWKGYDHFQDRIIVPNLNDRQSTGIELGKELISWLNDGKQVTLAIKEQIEHFDQLCTALKLTPEKITAKLESKGFFTKESVTESAMSGFINSLEEALKKQIEKEKNGVN